MDTRYELVVIGAGAAGITAASIGTTLGVKVLMIERNRIGGDCTWFGCVPSKALLRSAHVAHLIQNAATFGLNVPQSHLAQGVTEHVRKIIAGIAQTETPDIFREKGIDVIIGNPEFTSQDTLTVQGETVGFKKCILSTGSHPLVFPIPGIDTVDYLTNETVFSLKTLPEDMIILGGGPIGVEMAQSFRRLGVKISLVEMAERILFREEKELSASLHRQLEEEEVILYTAHKGVALSKTGGNITLTIENAQKEKKEISAQKILIALGREPNVEALNLEKAYVCYSKKGIQVNRHLQTTNKRIFAAGDVVGPYQFSHIANYQAQIAVRNALFRRIAWQKTDYSHIAWATFTDPELAHCGFTEDQARAQRKRINVYTTEYSACDRAVTDRKTKGMVKIIVDHKGRLLGAHAVGASAGEIIHLFITAKTLKIPVAKLSEVVYIYPTLSELVKKVSQKSKLELLKNPLIKALMFLMRTK